MFSGFEKLACPSALERLLEPEFRVSKLVLSALS